MKYILKLIYIKYIRFRILKYILNILYFGINFENLDGILFWKKINKIK